MPPDITPVHATPSQGRTQKTQLEEADANTKECMLDL